MSKDDDNRSSVVQQVSENEMFEEIIFSPNYIEPEVLYDCSQQSSIEDENMCGELAGSSGSEGKKTIWLESSTKLLISLVKVNVGKSIKLKNKKQMW